jgi:hypothetical protein
MKPLITAMFALASCTGDPKIIGSGNSAVVGDQVGPVLPLPAGARCRSGIGTSVAVVPASTIDETLTVPFLLATSCDDDSSARNQIYFTNPHPNPPGPPVLVATITTPYVSDFGWGSLALRADRSDLIGCTSNMAGNHDVYKIDIKTGAATFLFEAAAGFDICDGVAWDAATDTVYMSPDVSNTIYTYPLDASDNVISTTSFPVPFDSLAGDSCPNSGLAVSGDSIWAACNGNVRVEQISKTTHALMTSFHSGTQRTEDVECDPLSFEGKDVIWTKEAYLDEVFAFEIPRGSCNLAGTVPNPLPAVPPGPGYCCPGPACCPPAAQVDTDHDGLLDCWEDNKGIDFDGDCAIDLNLANYPSAGDNPDKNHKDIYVELDYMNGIAISSIALNNVQAAFAAGTNNNPDGTPGIHFHYQIDEAVNGSPTADPTTVFEPCSIPGAATTFDSWKAAKFGTAAERALGANTLNAKRLIFHYGLFIHQLQGKTAAAPPPLPPPPAPGAPPSAPAATSTDPVMGCAEVPGDDFVIVRDGFASFTAAAQGAVLLHELGHNLNLRHGGGSNIDFQPNYVSVMNDSLLLNNWQALRCSEAGWAGNLCLSPDQASWNEAGGIDEAAGVPQDIAGRHTLYWRPGGDPATALPHPVDTLVATDFNAAGGLQAGQTMVLTRDRPIPTYLPGYDDWSNLVLDFRLAIDYAYASHLSMLSNEEVTTPSLLAQAADTDGDGVDNVVDNCVLVANPDQADANHNGIGDACEVKPTVCLIHRGDRSELRAVFGYVNADFSIAIPIGPDNTVGGPGTIARGSQPTVFPSGTRVDAFEVVFDHKTAVSWTLNGNTATADIRTHECRP